MDRVQRKMSLPLRNAPKQPSRLTIDQVIALPDRRNKRCAGPDFAIATVRKKTVARTITRFAHGLPIGRLCRLCVLPAVYLAIAARHTTVGSVALSLA